MTYPSFNPPLPCKVAASAPLHPRQPCVAPALLLLLTLHIFQVTPGTWMNWPNLAEEPSCPFYIFLSDRNIYVRKACFPLPLFKHSKLSLLLIVVSFFLKDLPDPCQRIHHLRVTQHRGTIYSSPLKLLHHRIKCSTNVWELLGRKYVSIKAPGLLSFWLRKSNFVLLRPPTPYS